MSASRNLQFEFLSEICDLAASYARSASEAAYRGDQLTLGTHLRQMRLVLIESLKTFKELEDLLRQPTVADNDERERAA
jgi:hypothetical protein